MGDTRRFQDFKSILESKNYFKLVCGAGNQDHEWVERLVFVYTMAGAIGIDVAADAEVVMATVKGIERAEQFLREIKGQRLVVRPFITVSVGMPGDHHVRKAWFNDACSACDACIPVCPTDAIPEGLVVIDELCIGCGACDAACHFNAVEYTNVSHNLEELLPELLALGADNVELHAAVPNDDVVMAEWQAVCDVVTDSYCSMSIDRNHLSNTALMIRIEKAREIAGERTMIQADGVPMGGTGGDIGKTIQAIAIADQINRMFHFDIKRKRTDRQLMVLLSGGTNNETRVLAEAAGLEYHGVAIGTFARKQIQNEIQINAIFDDTELIDTAVAKAKAVVDASVTENDNVVALG